MQYTSCMYVVHFIAKHDAANRDCMQYTSCMYVVRYFIAKHDAANRDCMQYTSCVCAVHFIAKRHAANRECMQYKHLKEVHESTHCGLRARDWVRVKGLEWRA